MSDIIKVHDKYFVPYMTEVTVLERIAQLVVVPVVQVALREVLDFAASQRGDGGELHCRICMPEKMH